MPDALVLWLVIFAVAAYVAVPFLVSVRGKR